MSHPEALQHTVLVIGGGPAGLMAAEAARAQGAPVLVVDRMASAGRKLLIAGKGGLNLTHSEPAMPFRDRYRERAAEIGRWLDGFDADALRQWALELGIPTFVGSSGRVFPEDLKAAPLLRGWLRRLRAQGVEFRFRQRWLGWDAEGRQRFVDDAGEAWHGRPAATVLALGGGSWARLGSDGHWVEALREQGLPVRGLCPANCGFELDWSPLFRERHAGAPLRRVALGAGDEPGRLGEFVISDYGIEGSLVYALSAELREAITRHGALTAWLDLCPERSQAQVLAALVRPRGKRSISEHLRRQLGLQGVRAALLRECAPAALQGRTDELAVAIKRLPLRLLRARPLDEAISSAGGLLLEALDDTLMLRDRPGVFCAGEMLDWEAPTGGYLLQACFASGRIAGASAGRWALQQQHACGTGIINPTVITGAPA